MFLTAGMRLVAASCVGLGLVNVMGFVIHYLTLTEPMTSDVLHLIVALVIAQLGTMVVGIALFRFHKAGWFAFWPLSICSVTLIAKLLETHHTRTGEFDETVFVIGIELALWFVASAICLMLPSSRRCYFNITDQLWMHQKVLRHGEEKFGAISGRPKKPVGISVMAWLAIVMAGLVFVSGMLKLAEPSGFNPEEPHAEAVAGWKVFAAVCLVIASAGFMQKKIWSWHAMLWCSIVGIVAITWLWSARTGTGLAAGFHVTTEGLILTLIWCGSAIVYLLLPVTRHSFFSRRRSHFRETTVEDAG